MGFSDTAAKVTKEAEERAKKAHTPKPEPGKFESGSGTFFDKNGQPIDTSTKKPLKGK